MEWTDMRNSLPQNSQRHKEVQLLCRTTPADHQEELRNMDSSNSSNKLVLQVRQAAM